ncbi:hypothetical protein ACO1O0_000308 [Amphichorda felina]
MLLSPPLITRGCRPQSTPLPSTPTSKTLFGPPLSPPATDCVPRSTSRIIPIDPSRVVQTRAASRALHAVTAPAPTAPAPAHTTSPPNTRKRLRDVEDESSYPPRQYRRVKAYPARRTDNGRSPAPRTPPSRPIARPRTPPSCAFAPEAIPRSLSRADFARNAIIGKARGEEDEEEDTQKTTTTPRRSRKGDEQARWSPSDDRALIDFITAKAVLPAGDLEECSLLLGRRLSGDAVWSRWRHLVNRGAVGQRRIADEDLTPLPPMARGPAQPAYRVSSA